MSVSTRVNGAASKQAGAHAGRVQIKTCRVFFSRKPHFFLVCLFSCSWGQACLSSRPGSSLAEILGAVTPLWASVDRKLCQNL